MEILIFIGFALFILFINNKNKNNHIERKDKSAPYNKSYSNKSNAYINNEYTGYYLD